ncbi:MAG: hypothetical protein O9327_02065 [Polaromonas sp.]|nr:hypothetical protein [Polaromonas sp.]
MSARMSAVQRLMALPDAFSLNVAATLMDVDKEVAKVYLSRWSTAGYIQSSGPRTGFYFNVLKNRQAASDCLPQAILHVHPTALVRGATVLHAAGVTTQITHQVDVAVLAPANRAHTNGFVEWPKPHRWYVAVNEFKSTDGLMGLPSLDTEAALADMYATPGDWHPDVDDLEVDDIDWGRFKVACERFGIDVPSQLKPLVAKAAPLTPRPARKRTARP